MAAWRQRQGERGKRGCLGGLLLLLSASVPEALAGTAPPGFYCTFNVADVDFGNVNVITGSGLSTTSTIRITCRKGAAYGRVSICLSLGYGSGNPSAWNPRQMDSAGNKLNYNLYKPGTNDIWGSYYWSGSAQPVRFVVNLDSAGNGSWTYNLDARIAPGQNSVKPGLYVSNFSGPDVVFEYYHSRWTTCPLRVDGRESPAFQVRAYVIPFCEVSATDIDFGTTGLLNTNVDASGQVSVRCTNGTPYQVRLNGGQAGASSPDQRLMTKGSESVRYGIYRDSARTQGWGDLPGNAVAGVGTGNFQTYTTYGRVFPQTTPSPGIYTDTVVVTVVY